MSWTDTASDWFDKAAGIYLESERIRTGDRLARAADEQWAQMGEVTRDQNVGAVPFDPRAWATMNQTMQQRPPVSPWLIAGAVAALAVVTWAAAR